jgi:hypothetical protein
MVPEPSPVAGVASIEDAMDLASYRYVDFPSIRTITLDAPELPRNDREMLEVATERMFAEPSILEPIRGRRRLSAPCRVGGGRGGC